MSFHKLWQQRGSHRGCSGWRRDEVSMEAATRGGGKSGTLSEQKMPQPLVLWIFC